MTSRIEYIAGYTIPMTSRIEYIVGYTIPMTSRIEFIVGYANSDDVTQQRIVPTGMLLQPCEMKLHANPIFSYCEIRFAVCCTFAQHSTASMVECGGFYSYGYGYMYIFGKKERKRGKTPLPCMQVAGINVYQIAR